MRATALACLAGGWLAAPALAQPAQRVLMIVDVVFPGWMPWRRFVVEQSLRID